MLGFSKLIIEGDNVNVMQAISLSRNNSSLLGYVVDDIHHLVHCLEWARISITRRGGNKVAHFNYYDYIVFHFKFLETYII